MKLTVTGMMIIVVFVTLLLWTGIAQKYGNPTISMTMRDWAWEWNTTALIAGILISHWYVSLKKPLTRAFGYTLPFILGYLAFDLVWFFKDYVNGWYRWPIIPHVVGLVVGSFFWGQSHGDAPI